MNHVYRFASAQVEIYEDPFSTRIRVDDYSGPIAEVAAAIRQHTPDWAGKVIIKSRTQDTTAFLSLGYRKEASIKGYFAGVDMDFVVQYPQPERSISNLANETVTSSSPAAFVPRDIIIRVAGIQHAEAIAELYKKVVTLYPTPIQDPAYLRSCMEGGSIYCFVEEDGQVVSAAAAEINKRYRNAELTDCATLPQAQGRQLMQHLLHRLEAILREKDFICSYTIARSESKGINKAFRQLGYTYGGKMTKNCVIHSGLEDMNVWYKILSQF